MTAQRNAIDCGLDHKGAASLLLRDKPVNSILLFVRTRTVAAVSFRSGIAIASRAALLDAKPLLQIINIIVVALSLALPATRDLARLVFIASTLSSSFPAPQTPTSHTVLETRQELQV